MTQCSQRELVHRHGQVYAADLRLHALSPNFRTSILLLSAITSMCYTISSCESRLRLIKLYFSCSYDHLDLACIQEIARSHRRKDVTFLVPLGIKPLIKSAGISEERICELDWWDKVALPAKGIEPPSLSLNFTCVPAQHTSGSCISALFSNYSSKILHSRTKCNG